MSINLIVIGKYKNFVMSIWLVYILKMKQLFFLKYDILINLFIKFESFYLISVAFRKTLFFINLFRNEMMI